MMCNGDVQLSAAIFLKFKHLQIINTVRKLIRTENRAQACKSLAHKSIFPTCGSERGLYLNPLLDLQCPNGKVKSKSRTAEHTPDGGIFLTLQGYTQLTARLRRRRCKS